MEQAANGHTASANTDAKRLKPSESAKSFYHRKLSSFDFDDDDDHRRSMFRAAVD